METHPSTIVVQSFRNRDVPVWIERCLSTIRHWATQSQFQYRIIGDEFFDLVPPWYRRKAGRYLTVVTDLARLLLARKCLGEGYARVVWVDADVVVFNPRGLSLDPGLSYGYCREVWVKKNRSQGLSAFLKINNAACLFRDDPAASRHLDDYIGACTSLVAGLARIRDHTEVGTKLLTSWDRERALPILKGFGLINPVIMQALLTSDTETLKLFMEWQHGPLYAANLCNFFRAGGGGDRGIKDEVYSAVLDKLLEGEGSLLNRWRTAETSAAI